MVTRKHWWAFTSVGMTSCDVVCSDLLWWLPPHGFRNLQFLMVLRLKSHGFYMVVMIETYWILNHNHRIHLHYYHKCLVQTIKHRRYPRPWDHMSTDPTQVWWSCPSAPTTTTMMFGPPAWLGFEKRWTAEGWHLGQNWWLHKSHALNLLWTPWQIGCGRQFLSDS